MNTEEWQQPRYNAAFVGLTGAELDELLSIVFRQCGESVNESLMLEAAPR